MKQSELQICYAAKLQLTQKVSGDNDYEGTPVPIPNTEVKLVHAENTCRLPCWEDRSLPDFFYA